MAEINQDDNFLAVDIQEFRRGNRDIDFDLYLKLSTANYAHIFSRNSGIDYKRLAQYVQKGVEELYIKESDSSAFERFKEKKIDTILTDPDASREKKVATLLNMTEQAIAEVFTQCDVLEGTATNTKKLVNNYIDIMADSPRTLSIVLKLASHGDYLYYHSVAVAIFSMYMAKATGQFNRQYIEILGMGGFLHDIGCTYLPGELMESSDDLTPAQWKEMRQHPKLGLKMIEHTPSIPDEVRYIVYQHHEIPNGEGYPNGLQRDAIFYPAKIVAVADAFSALISKRPYREAYSIDQAIKILQADTVKYDAQLVEILANIFQRGKPASSAA